MKISLIAPTHLPSKRANTIQVMKMAQALVSGGHEVLMLAPGADPNLEWNDIAKHYGLERQFPIEWQSARTYMRRYDFGYRAVRRAQNWKADLIYTRLPQSAAFASVSGLPTILEVHDLPRSRMGKILFSRFLKGSGARRLVVITHALAEDLGEKLSAPQDESFTIVAPDGVDLNRYQNLLSPNEAREKLGFPDRFTAGYTGHMYAGRGVEQILSMAAGLPEIIFLLVGGEPGDVARLESEVNTAGLQNIILTGFVPNAELHEYQSACDVLLMPYQDRVAASSGGDIGRYLSPMKLFEYLACGRPIISSDLKVFREVLSEENAVLLAPDDLDAWLAALLSLQNDPKRRAKLAVSARASAAAYSWEARATRMLEGL